MADNIDNNNNNKPLSDAEQRKNARQASNKRASDGTILVRADSGLSAVWVTSTFPEKDEKKPEDNTKPVDSANPTEAGSPLKTANSANAASPAEASDSKRDEAVNHRNETIPASTDSIGISGTKDSNNSPEPEKKAPSRRNAIQEKGEKTEKKKPILASTRKKLAEKAEQAEIIAAKAAKKARKKQKRHRRFSIFKVILFVLALALIIGITGCGILAISVITHAEKIDADNIYANISQNSVMYDADENVIENVMGSGLRTNLDYEQIPSAMLSAFISIEDKTFWHHHGFNFVRIAGAIVESITTGGDISGTSTLTQQLARNVFLSDIKSERSLTRKMTEAYYTIVLERHLSKNQIIEAYLNTIYLGFNSYGVEAAAETYFGKTASELNLAECSALACIPKNPTKYALIKRYYANEVDSNNSNIISTQGEYVLVYNDAFKERQKLVLENMVSEGYIDQQQADEAYAYDLQQSINPPATLDGNSQTSSYYTDYAKEQVVDILMEEMDLDESEATSMLYSGGLSIYTALDTDTQQIVEEAFANNKNFPSAQSQSKDRSGNMLNSNGQVMLYNYNNYYNDDGSFTLEPDEYMYQADGSLCIFAGNRLSFYSSTTDGETTNVSINFKPTYIYENGLLYISSSGQITLDSVYKKKDSDGNLVISQEFLEANPGVFVESSSGLTVPASYVTINEKVVQPQGSMVIMDQSTGCIVAMVGGRNITGSKLYNRADSPRQPGSSIKPLAVYTPAILKGYTGATIIADSPNYVNGKLWPKNSYSGYKGNVTMRQAVQSSINVVAVRVLEEVGIDNSYNFVKSLGISTLTNDDKSLAALGLGGLTDGLKPVESCGAYATIANGGVYNRPTTITKIVDSSGKVIFDMSKNTQKTVFDDGTAFLMTDILRTAVSSGTGTKARIYSNNSTIPVAGKTGTTTANYDAWFCGFTPYYTAVVWIGNDYNIQLSNGSGAAASLWSTVMKQVHSGLSAKSFEKPDSVAKGTDYYVIGRDSVKGKSEKTTTVRVCTQSGLLAVSGCPHTKTISATSGKVPTRYCNLHSSEESEDPSDDETTDEITEDTDDDGTADNSNGTTNTNSNSSTNKNNNTSNNNSNSNNNNNNNNNSTPATKPDDDSYIEIPQ